MRLLKCDCTMEAIEVRTLRRPRVEPVHTADCWKRGILRVPDDRLERVFRGNRQILTCREILATMHGLEILGSGRSHHTAVGGLL